MAEGAGVGSSERGLPVEQERGKPGNQSMFPSMLLVTRRGTRGPEGRKRGLPNHLAGGKTRRGHPQTTSHRAVVRLSCANRYEGLKGSDWRDTASRLG